MPARPPVLQIALACALSGLIGAYLSGSFPIADSTYTASCGLSMQSSSVCVAGFVTTALTIVAMLAMIGMQCAAVDQQQVARYGFCGPLISILGFIWWLGYSIAATSAATTGNHWDSTLTAYRTAVVAVSWTATGVYIPVFLVSAVTVSAAARAAAKVNDPRSSSIRRFSQPASPPVSPIKSSKSFGSSYGELQRAVHAMVADRRHAWGRRGRALHWQLNKPPVPLVPCPDPFKEHESPKKWIQPQNPHSGRFAVTSDGHRTLLVVAGQPVPLSPSPSMTHSPSASPARSPSARSPATRGLTSAGSFTTILLPNGSEDLSSYPGHA